MQITVEYAAQIKRAAGTSTEQVDVSAPCSLQELAAMIAQRHGDGLKDLLFDAKGTLRKSVLFFIDDQQVVDGAGRQVSNAERVTIMTPISGG